MANRCTERGCNCSPAAVLPPHFPGAWQADAGSFDVFHGGGRIPGRVSGCWLYDPVDPAAVTLRLRSAPGWVDWCTGRALVAEGVRTPHPGAGAGDVRIEVVEAPSGALLVIELLSPHGRVVLLGDAQRTRRALDLFYGRVSARDEAAAVQAGVDRVLASLRGCE